MGSLGVISGMAFYAQCLGIKSNTYIKFDCSEKNIFQAFCALMTLVLTAGLFGGAANAWKELKSLLEKKETLQLEQTKQEKEKMSPLEQTTQNEEEASPLEQTILPEI